MDCEELLGRGSSSPAASSLVYKYGSHLTPGLAEVRSMLRS